METSVYKGLLNSLSGTGVSSEAIGFDQEASFNVTVKNYKMKNGLSIRISDSKDSIFQIQGPMGKGLDIQPTGTHIAFSAGTGCLVFVDLVAHLIRKNLGLLQKDE